MLRTLRKRARLQQHGEKAVAEKGPDGELLSSFEGMMLRYSGIITLDYDPPATIEAMLE